MICLLGCVSGDSAAKQPTVRMRSSFNAMKKAVSTVDIRNYIITVHGGSPGHIFLETQPATKSEALSAALFLTSNTDTMEKYGVSKHVANLIMYSGGVVIIGYKKQENVWELFDEENVGLTCERPYTWFDIIKK